MTDESKHKLHINSTMLGGLLTGAFCKFVGHPIDTIKAQIQVSTSTINFQKSLKNNLFSVGYRIVSSQGIKGLYPGVGISVTLGAPATMIYFGIFEKAKYAIRNKLNWKNEMAISFWAAICAEIGSCVLWLPIDVIKERLQVQHVLKTYHYENAIDAAIQISRKEGI